MPYPVADYLSSDDLWKVAGCADGLIRASRLASGGSTANDPRLRRLHTDLAELGKIGATLSDCLSAPTPGGFSHDKAGSFDAATETPSAAAEIGGCPMSAEDIAVHGPLLGLISADQRSRLVKAAIGVKDEAHQSIAIAGLARGWERLSQDERSDLVVAVLNMVDSTQRARSIAGTRVSDWPPLFLHALDGIGLGMAHLRSGSAQPLPQMSAGCAMEEPSVLAA